MAHRDNSDCALAGCCLLQACGYWGRWCNPRNYHRCWLVCHLLSRAVCRVHCSLHFRPSPPNCWATCFSASRNRWSYSLHSGFRAPRSRPPNTLTPPTQTNRTLCTAFLLQTCIFFFSLEEDPLHATVTTRLRDTLARPNGFISRTTPGDFRVWPVHKNNRFIHHTAMNIRDHDALCPQMRDNACRIYVNCFSSRLHVLQRSKSKSMCCAFVSWCFE